MKIKFNLQPWRENIRIAQQKRFIATTAMVILGVCAICGFNYYIENKYLEEQAEAQRLLQNEINNLKSAEAKVEETKLLIAEVNKQIVAIEELQSRRGIVLKLLDHIANETPESVFLDSINFDGKRLVITGIAENDTGVAEFLRILQASELLLTPKVDVIRSATSTGRYMIPEEAEIKSFTVSVELAI